MLDDTFAEALIHRRRGGLIALLRPQVSSHAVLGRRLPPFSFWHACLLDLLKNPFGFYDASEDNAFDFAKAFDFPAHFLGGHIFLDYPALQEAVGICRCLYPHWPSAGGKLGYILRLLALRHYARIAPADCNQSSSSASTSGLPPISENSPYLGELAKLSAYFLEYRTRPIHAELENSKPAKTPWYLVSVVGLMRLGLSKTEAWNTPAGEGAWLTAAASEASGHSIEILTAQDRKDFAEILSKTVTSHQEVT